MFPLLSSLLPIYCRSVICTYKLGMCDCDPVCRVCVPLNGTSFDHLCIRCRAYRARLSSTFHSILHYFPIFALAGIAVPPWRGATSCQIDQRATHILLSSFLTMKNEPDQVYLNSFPNWPWALRVSPLQGIVTFI